ncbi:unnamed protein product [Haemonchus placei]|uniref:7TM_GPCR_Srx domain-containing protein n=1 Tax=Haemonchus placei TaxID=6290 RepID=A0A0N4WLK3_HAEPC|nr:unnamed protein product [Haemonchus placei]
MNLNRATGLCLSIAGALVIESLHPYIGLLRIYKDNYSLLLANLAGYHLVCIACQWVNLSYSVNHQLPRQDECFKLILPYIFAISAQAIMYVVIVGDLLAAVLVPLR